MDNYIEEYQIIKEKLFKYRKDDVIKKRALFIKEILNKKVQGYSIAHESIKFGKSRKYFYFWMKRLREHNYDISCLRGYSKAPKNSPNETPEEIIDMAEEIRGDDSTGGHYVARIMRIKHNIQIAGSTVCHHLRKRGVAKIYKYKKNRGHTKRYAAENPLKRVQIDTTWSGFENNYGNRIYFSCAVDDCSRVVTVSISDSKSSMDAVEGLEKFINEFGKPELIQTDNGVEFTNKYISLENPIRDKDPVFSAFEQKLEELKIFHYKIRKRTPQLNGKVERFNQTIKKAMENRLYNGVTLGDARSIVDEWVDWYNTIKPHASLKYMTPYQKFYGVPRARSA